MGRRVRLFFGGFVLVLAAAGECRADGREIRDSSNCSTAGIVGPIDRGQERLMRELADAGLRGYQLDYFDPSTHREVDGLRAPKSREEFCAQARDLSVFQRRIHDLDNRLSFRNPARGFFNGGVCWWHSRFTRNAAYLTYTNPGAPKPKLTEARKIIDQIASGTGPVELPGYSGLREFSKDFEEEIIQRLVRWQAVESTAGFAWVRGMTGASRSPSAKLSRQMDELYDRIENRKQVVYQMLQIPGVDAHSWLVTGMRRTDEGYELLVHDSNSPHLLAVPYRRGDERIVGRQFSAVPYTSYEGEVDSLLAQVAAACASERVRARIIGAGSDASRRLRGGGRAAETQAGEYEREVRIVAGGAAVQDIARRHPSWVLGRDAVTPDSWARLFQ